MLTGIIEKDAMSDGLMIAEITHKDRNEIS